ACPEPTGERPFFTRVGRDLASGGGDLTRWIDERRPCISFASAYRRHLNHAGSSRRQAKGYPGRGRPEVGSLRRRPGVHLPTMKARRVSLGRSPRSQLGMIDYTLAKRALIREAKIGVLSQSELCDAHPELLRAARYVGEPTNSDCPVCERENLVLLA